jgi:hypothetical protein
MNIKHNVVKHQYAAHFLVGSSEIQQPIRAESLAAAVLRARDRAIAEGWVYLGMVINPKKTK